MTRSLAVNYRRQAFACSILTADHFRFFAHFSGEGFFANRSGGIGVLQRPCINDTDHEKRCTYNRSHFFAASSDLISVMPA